MGRRDGNAIESLSNKIYVAAPQTAGPVREDFMIKDLILICCIAANDAELPQSEIFVLKTHSIRLLRWHQPLYMWIPQAECLCKLCIAAMGDAQCVTRIVTGGFCPPPGPLSKTFSLIPQPSRERHSIPPVYADAVAHPCGNPA